MAKFDSEQLYRDIESIMKNNLNDKIDEINTEKADGINMRHVVDAAYVFQSMNEEVVNYDPFIFFGEEAVSTDSIGPGTARTFQVDIGIIMQTQNDANAGFLLQRYRRALREVFEKNYNKLKGVGRFMVTDLAPWPLAHIESETLTIGIGVTLTFTIA